MYHPRPKTPSHQKSFRGLLTLCAVALTTITAQAEATWYLQENMPKNVPWSRASLWNSAPDGSGTAATSINKEDSYNTNGKYVRANGTFSGGKLIQDGGRIDIKRSSQTINGDWEVTGSKATLHQGVRNNASYIYTVNGRLILTSPLTVLHTNDGMRGIDLTIGTLTGSADLIIGSGNVSRNTFVSLGVMQFDNYTGHLIVDAGSSLSFANDQTWTAPLEVAVGGVVSVNRNVSFPSVSLAGQVLSPGTYPAEQLHEKYPTVVTENSKGTLTVTP